jgi:hypothetical protein
MAHHLGRLNRRNVKMAAPPNMVRLALWVHGLFARRESDYVLNSGGVVEMFAGGLHFCLALKGKEEVNRTINKKPDFCLFICC